MPLRSDNSAKSPSQRPRVGVLGATLGTGNLGVDALGMAMVQGLVTAIPDVEIVYQSWDLRLPVTIPLGEDSVECEPLAIRRKGSLRHRDGLLQIKKLAKLQRWLSTRPVLDSVGSQLSLFSGALKQLLSCDAILDVSAGDSFANIYGQEVFWYQTQIKLLCLELGLPLVLMPQTYGPYDEDGSSEIAAAILSHATLVCSREADGLEEIKQLCGDQPPQQLVRVPDMAFLLEPREIELPTRFQQARSNNAPCIALNVSGLLYDPRQSFALHVEYKQLCKEILQWALSIPNSHVLLVPHVVAPSCLPGTKSPSIPSSDNTDTFACEKLLAGLDEAAAARVDMLPAPKDPAQAKYAMNLCDFFVGARMHAFIGAVSQAVPGALLAYSKKANGLASLLGIGDSVVDMRTESVEACVAAINAQYQCRQATQTHLEERVPLAKAELERFFREAIAPIMLEKTSPISTPHLQAARSGSNSEQKRVMN